jgi:hypothetical protein
MTLTVLEADEHSDLGTEGVKYSCTQQRLKQTRNRVIDSGMNDSCVDGYLTHAIWCSPQTLWR